MVPGAAHIDLGRAKRGLFLFFLFAFFVNGALIAPFLGLGGGIRIVCALIAAGGWVAALVDALRIAANRAGDKSLPIERKLNG
jgi:hypothetical protein